MWALHPAAVLNPAADMAPFVVRLSVLAVLLTTASGYISSIEPRYGSLAGGTVITIHGNGLIANDTLAVDVFIGNIRCDLQWYRSNNERLYCQTRGIHHDIGENYQLTYSNWMTGSLTTCKECTFTYNDDHTPYLTSWSKTMASRGLFRLGGVLKARFAEQYEIIFDGGHRCTGLMRRGSPRLQFGLDLYEQVVAEHREEELDLTCYLPVVEAGFKNFTVHVRHFTQGVIQSPGDTHSLPFRGMDNGLGYAMHTADEMKSINSYYVAGQDMVRARGSHVYSVVILPQIQSLSTQRSGSLGRQRLVIRGSGFAASNPKRGCTANVVQLGGVSCAVTFCSANELHCIVGDSSSSDRVTDRPFPSTIGLHRIGYSSSSAPPTNTIKSSFTFAESMLSSTAELTTKLGTSVRSELFTGFFVAPMTAWYSFYVASSDNCDIAVSKTDNILGAGVSASCSRDNRVDYFSSTQQKTDQIFLTAGSRHAIKMRHWNPRSSAYFKAAVRIHDPPVAKTTEEVQYHTMRERQEVSFNVNYQHEVVELAFSNVHPDSFFLFQRVYEAYDLVYNYTSLAYDSVSVTRMRQSDLVYLNDSMPIEHIVAIFKSKEANPINCYDITVNRTSGVGWVNYTITTGCLPRRSSTTRNNIGSFIATSLISQNTQDFEDESGSGDDGSGDLVTAAPSPAPLATLHPIRTMQLPTYWPSGFFTLSFDGVDYISLDIQRIHDSSYLKDKFLLFNNVGDVDFRIINRFKNPAFGFIVEFLKPDGHDYPNMIINSTHVRPYPSENRGLMNATVETILDGNVEDLFYDPIPEYMFEMDTNLPAAVVTVNDVVAECSTGRNFVDRMWDNYTTAYEYGYANRVYSNDCSFIYNDDDTPQIFNTSSDHPENHVTSGDEIRITGAGFAQPTLEASIQVFVGGTKCLVSNYTDTQIVCILSDMKTGKYHPSVITEHMGLAMVMEGAEPVHYAARVDNVEPLSGSVRGGNILAITGTGFSSIGPENQVTVGAGACAVISSSTTSITCYAPFAPIENIDEMCWGGIECNNNSDITTPGSSVTHDISWGFSGVAQASITVNVGDTVRWNFDQLPTQYHNVKSGARGDGDTLFRSGNPQSSGSYSYTFTQAGSFPFHCEPHDTMNAVVTVVSGDRRNRRSIPESVTADVSVRVFEYKGTQLEDGTTIGIADGAWGPWDDADSIYEGVLVDKEYVTEIADGSWGPWGKEVSGILRDTKYYGYSCKRCQDQLVVEHQRWGTLVDDVYTRDIARKTDARDGAWSSWSDGAWSGWQGEESPLSETWNDWHNGTWGDWITASTSYEYDWSLTPSITKIVPSSISSARTTRVTITGDFSSFTLASSGASGDCEGTMRFVSPSGLFRECVDLELQGDSASCTLVRGKSFPREEQQKMLPWLKLCHPTSGLAVVAHPEPDCCSPPPYYGRVDLALRIDTTSPSSGSLAGGTLLTINGAGFGPVDGKIVRSALTYNYFDAMTVVNITTDHKILSCDLTCPDCSANFSTIICQTPMLEADDDDVHQLSFYGRYIYSGTPGRNARIAVSVNDIEAAGCDSDPDKWKQPTQEESPSWAAWDPVITAPVVGESCETVETDGGVGVWDYRFIFRDGLVDFSTGIIFNVAANHDAIVTLSPHNTTVGAQRGIEMYEITLGGWGNSQSSIARTKFGTAQRSVSTELLLDAHGGSDFWITLVGGTITVGSGCQVGRGTFMSWTDPQPIQGVNYFGVATADTPGSWVHCLDSADAPLGTCGTTPPSRPTTVQTTPFYNLTYEDSASTFRCEFDFTDAATPILTNVENNVLFGSQLLSVIGTGFNSEPHVSLGLYTCDVQEWNSTFFSCMAPEMTAGHYHLQVRIPGAGYAAHPSEHDPQFIIESELRFTNLSPQESSLRGGLTVTVTGSGFSLSNAENSVTVGSRPAHVLNSTFDQLVFVVPSLDGNTTDTNASIVISVATERVPLDFQYGQVVPTAHRYTNGKVNTQSILETTVVDYFRSVNSVHEDNETGIIVLPANLHVSSDFCSDPSLCVILYEEDSTPGLQSVSPTSGSMGGTLIITGTDFGSDVNNVDVLIGGQICAVQTVNPTTCQCTLGATPAGTHEIYLTNHATGTARVNGVVFQSILSVTSVDVDHGSYGGGHDITITGYGFGGGETIVRRRRDGAWGGWIVYDYGTEEVEQSQLGTSVTLCDQDCVVTESSYNRIVCTTPPMISPESISAFGAKDSSVLSGTVVSTGESGSTIYGAAFDGDYETAFTSGLAPAGAPPADTVSCASEGGMCQCTGSVWYGTVTDWVSQEVTGTIHCANSVFGDPAPGHTKNCYCLSDAVISALPKCSTGLDLGASGSSIVTKIRYFPAHQRTELMIGGQFQISNDGSSWTTVFNVTSSLHEGWNSVSMPDLPATRHIRFVSRNHKCAIAFLEFRGLAASSTGVCPVNIHIQRSLSHPSTGVVSTDHEIVYSEETSETYTYEISETPIVTSISPRFGSSLGSTLINVSGQGLPTSTVSSEVTINGRECVVQNVSTDGSWVTCFTTRRTDFRPLSVAVRDIAGFGSSINNNTVYFRYIDRWSLSNTWLNDEMPLENDTVVVPPDQTILIDVPLPRLFLVLIQGFVMFDPEATIDLNMNATYILVYGGALQVGTHDEPFPGNVAITLHGDRYDTVEIPNFGSKVLAVADRGGLSESSFANGEGHEVPDSQRGVLDIHGTPRVKTWTTLSVTSVAGSDIVRTSEPVDYAPGEKLVITGEITRLNAGETNDLMADMPPPCQVEKAWEQISETSAEEVEVAQVIDSTTIRLTKPLSHNHVSEIITTPEGHVVDMRAQVGLLTRNVVIQGDDESPGQMFGAHTIAVHGGRFRVENAEVRNCGQANNLGRYCLHFHKAGYQPGGPDLDWIGGSYIIANSIHHSFQRATTIHGTTHATVTDNVAYKVHGHTYFVEDGDEEYVRLERNLGVETMISPYSLFSDCQAATFWTASPKNFWRDNVAANSHGHGFWFELDAGAAGDFTRHPTLDVSNNIYHDNNLRGWFIAPTYTPETPQYFRNNTYYRNQLDGVFYGVGGDTHHVGDKFVSNGGSADLLWWFFPSRESSRWIPNLKDVSFVGGHWGIGGPPLHNGGGALFAPNMEFFLVDGAEFYNYSDIPAISQCFDCCGYRSRQGAYTTRFAGLTFPGSDRRTTYACPAKQIFFDLDGSLSGQAGGTVTAFHRFNEWDECPRANETFSNGIVCNSSVRVRKLSIPSFLGPKRTEPREILAKDFYIKQSVMQQPIGFRFALPYQGDQSDPTRFEKKSVLEDIANFLALDYRHVVEDLSAPKYVTGIPVVQVIVGGYLDQPSNVDPVRRAEAEVAREWICSTGVKIVRRMGFTECATLGNVCECSTGYVRFGYDHHWAHDNSSAWQDGVMCDPATFGNPTLADVRAYEFASCECLEPNTVDTISTELEFSTLGSVFDTVPLSCSQVIEIPHECRTGPEDVIVDASFFGLLDEEAINSFDTVFDKLGDPHEGCFYQTHGHVPLDGVPGEWRTSEQSPLACQQRCADTNGCAFFSYWPNGGCHLTTGDAVVLGQGAPVDGDTATWGQGGPIITGPAFCLNTSLNGPPEDFYSMGVGTECVSLDEWYPDGWPMLYMREEVCKSYGDAAQVYDPIDYDSWTRDSIGQEPRAPGFSAVTCAHWVCGTPDVDSFIQSGARDGCLEWTCIEANPAESINFDGTWFIGDDAERDQLCRVQVCHEPVYGVDAAGEEVLVGCNRFRCTQAMLPICVEDYPIVISETECFEECRNTPGCTSARFYNSNDLSCRLFNIPHNQLASQYDNGGYSCTVYAPNRVPASTSCMDNSQATSETTCAGKLPRVDTLGGVNHRQYEAIGELFENRIGLDNIEFGPGLLRTMDSPPGFDFEGWAIPLVTHHDYILDLDGHIDFQQFSARWSEPYILQNPLPPADVMDAVPADARFSGAYDFMPLADGSVLLSFPYVDYRYRFRVDMPRFPNMPWYDKLADDCIGHACGLRNPDAGPTRGEITRFDDFGVNFIDREDDSLVTSNTRGTWKIAINPWAGVDTQCSSRPAPLNMTFSTKALQCSPYMCDSGIESPLGAAMKWSDPITWQMLAFEVMATPGLSNEGTKPDEWATVEIPAGFYMMLDESPPKLTKLIVYGKLEFLDESDLELHAGSIVNFGEIAVGSLENPFMHHAEIVIHGNRTSPTVVVSDQHFLGNKVIANFGNMSLHAASPSTIHEKLAETANIGDTSITMMGPVDWEIGDTVVITGTNYVQPASSAVTGTYTGNRFVVLPGPKEYSTSTEEIIVSGISGNRRIVSFGTPLVHRHFAGEVDVGLNQESFVISINSVEHTLEPRAVSHSDLGWESFIGNLTSFIELDSASACTGNALSSSFNGAIAVIARNTGCDILTHIRTAQLSGAGAVAIVEGLNSSVLLRDFDVPIPTLVLGSADGTAIFGALRGGGVVTLSPFGSPVPFRASAGNLRRNVVIRADMERGCTEAEHLENMAHYRQYCSDDVFACETEVPYPHDCYFIKGYGVHMLTGEINYGSEDAYAEALAGRRPHMRTAVGQIIASGVEFRDFGKLGSEHRGFVINYFHEYTSEEISNELDRCVFVNSWYDALVVGEAPAIRITNNIVHRTLGLPITIGDPLPTVNWNSRKPEGFVRRLRNRRTMSDAANDFSLVVGEAGSIIDDNLVTAAFDYPSSLVDAPKHYVWHSSFLLRRPMLSMRRNIASGGWSGMTFQLQDAHDFSGIATISDNEAYAGFYGIIARGASNEPRELFRCQAWSNGEAGFVAFDEYQDIQIREVSLADNKFGAAVSFKAHASFEVRQSHIIGSSIISDGVCTARVGITLPIYTPLSAPNPRCGGLFGPCKDCSVEGNMLSSRFGNTWTGRDEKLFVESTAFAYFGNDACDESRGIHLHPDSPDYSPDVYLTRIRWHRTVATNRRFTLGDRWGTHAGCRVGGFHLHPRSEGSCDALSYLRLYDTDGSTVGNFWSDGNDENYRNTVLYSDANPAITNEANCRAHANTRSIVCENYPLRTLAIDVPPITPDGGDETHVSFMVVHKYHPGNQRDSAYNRSYWSVGAFEQGCSCQKHFFGGSAFVEPEVMYDIDMPVEDALNADGDFEYWLDPALRTPEMHPMWVPPNTRFTYHSNDESECIVARLWMRHAKPIKIFMNGNNDMSHVKLADNSMPSVSSSRGTHALFPQDRRFYMTLCGDGQSGSASYVIRVEESIQVSVTIDMDYSEFFAEEIPDLDGTPLEDRISLYQRTLGLDRMVNNFALLLSVPQENIKVACVHVVGEPCIPLELMLATGGSNPTGGRRRRAAGSGPTAVEFEIRASNPLNETGEDAAYNENQVFFEAVTELLMNATENVTFQRELAELVQETVGDATNTTVQLIRDGLSLIISYGSNAMNVNDTVTVVIDGVFESTTFPISFSESSSTDAVGLAVGITCAVLVVILVVGLLLYYNHQQQSKKRQIKDLEKHPSREAITLKNIFVEEQHEAMLHSSETSFPPYPNQMPKLAAAKRVRDSLIDLGDLPVVEHSENSRELSWTNTQTLPRRKSSIVVLHDRTNHDGSQDPSA